MPFIVLFLILCPITHPQAQPSHFVVRSNDNLTLDGQPYYFLGANACYLMETAARGDTATVKEVFSTARALGLGVIRTWGFFDSPDSLNPAVIQYRPGGFNESAVRALDYVVYQAKINDIRLLIPLVNSWDDYGGMNQYVRWRVQYPVARGTADVPVDEHHAQQTVVKGPRGQSYRSRVHPLYGHDDFYADSLIAGWYKTYVAMVLQRTNTYTGVQLRDEPAIFGWELANEPRSSDWTGQLIARWTLVMSTFIKSIDRNHLVGTGEEGFDNTTVGYSGDAYGEQSWLFDGSAGVSFSANSADSVIDFASVHLYPESWNLSNSAGNTWIRDHIRIARSLKKPLVVGEFGVHQFRVPTYESWLTTTLLEGGSGAFVWQLMGGPLTDREGFGFRCPDGGPVCSTLQAYAAQFNLKTGLGMIPSPATYVLHQNYPNPFNGITTIAFDLPTESFVTLEVYDLIGRRIATLVDGTRGPGSRRELLDGAGLATGAYICTLTASPVGWGNGPAFTLTRKVLVVR